MKSPNFHEDAMRFRFGIDFSKPIQNANAENIRNMKAMKLAAAGLAALLASGYTLAPDKHVKASDGSEAALSKYAEALPLNTIRLPAGFKIDVYAEVRDARSLAISPSGTVYVGNKDGSSVYAIKDVDGDGKADKRWEVAKGLNMPNGVAFLDGDLYIAEEIGRAHV